MVPSNANRPDPVGGERISDEQMILACLEHHPFAWQTFVDRYLLAVSHMIEQFDRSHSLDLSPTQRDATALRVFAKLHENDFELLRRFKQNGSFETFLIICVRRILLGQQQDDKSTATESDPEPGTT